MSEERLQKILARAGIASRRKAEEMIEAGQVTINGQVAGLGDKADPETGLHQGGRPAGAAPVSASTATSCSTSPRG